MKNKDVNKLMAYSERVKAGETLTAKELDEIRVLLEPVIESMHQFSKVIVEVGLELARIVNEWWESIPKETRDSLIAKDHMLEYSDSGRLQATVKNGISVDINHSLFSQNLPSKYPHPMLRKNVN